MAAQGGADYAALHAWIAQSCLECDRADATYRRASLAEAADEAPAGTAAAG